MRSLHTCPRPFFGSIFRAFDYAAAKATGFVVENGVLTFRHGALLFVKLDMDMFIIVHAYARNYI